MGWLTEEEKENLEKQRKLNEIDYKLAELITDMKKYITPEKENPESSKLGEMLECQ